MWVGNLIAGYQGEVADDNDPNTYTGMEGITRGNREYSIVYVETIRDQLDSQFRNFPNQNALTNTYLKRHLSLTAAHEIGHMPGGGGETSHHFEGLLMGETGYDEGTVFSPLTIKRFRSTEKWQQPE